MNGRHLGSVVGVVGGLVFVFVNVGSLDLPAAADVAVAVAAVAAAGAVVAAIRSDHAVPPPVPTRQATTTYWVAVAAMVVAIPVGSVVLGALDLAEVRPCWVVAVVGAHFVPFARAFDADLYLGLAASLLLVSALGATLTLVGVDRAPPATSVLAGFVLLGWAWAGPRLAGSTE